MDSRNFRLHDGKKGAAMTVRIVPRSSRNELSEVLNDGTIKVRLKTSADDPALNQELRAFLAHVLDIPQNHVDVIAGLSGLDKLVSIVDLDADALQARILKNMI